MHLSLPEDFSYRLDLYTLFSFVGVVQGLFLAFFFLQKKEAGFRYLGGLILVMSLVTLEISLCYSGLIVHVLHFVDATEAFNFAYAPLLYLFVLSFNKKNPQNWYLHFVPFLLYTLYSCFFFLQSLAFKYNAFRHAYHPDWEELPNEQWLSDDPWGIKSIVNELSLLHFLIYLPFMIWQLYLFFQSQSTTKPLDLFRSKVHGWKFGMLILMLLSYVLWTYKTLFIFKDLGDNWGAALNTFIIYYLSFFVIKNGLLAEQKGSTEKYKKSAIAAPLKAKLLAKLEATMTQDHSYKNPQLSLQLLAAKIKTKPHYVSQVLNEQLALSFYEWLAIYRIEEAKRLLRSPNHQLLTIEAIGQTAGFHTRSAFYKAFKKSANMTPYAYRKQYLTVGDG